jgi:hypothetical protein
MVPVQAFDLGAPPASAKCHDHDLVQLGLAPLAGGEEPRQLVLVWVEEAGPPPAVRASLDPATRILPAGNNARGEAGRKAKLLILLTCRRRESNPHALRREILSQRAGVRKWKGVDLHVLATELVTGGVRPSAYTQVYPCLSPTVTRV